MLRLKETSFLRCLDLKETCWQLSRYGSKCRVREIRLRGRKDLTGTLSESFKELKDLETLDLSDTKISGDLAVLANCTQMKRLLLCNTFVAGDLAALPKARMMSLFLSNTKVTGNLGALNGTELSWVRLSNTTIAGDVAVLGTWPEIYEVDVSDTEVTGTFHVNKRFRNLQVLKLTGTRSKIDFMGGRDSSECPFPKMTTLEISGSAVDSSVSEFLVPLLECQHLNSIGAAGCGLIGEVPKTVLLRGREQPFDWTFLSNSLSFLDLASNRIDRQSEFYPEQVENLGAGRQ